jgi:hypothetical protein
LCYIATNKSTFINIHTVYNNCISWQKLYSVYESKIKITYWNGFAAYPVAFCVFFFSFTFFIWTRTWKIVVCNYASCAAILFIYVRRRSGRATIFHLLPAGIHCIYLKSRDHKSANHVWCSPKLYNKFS